MKCEIIDHPGQIVLMIEIRRIIVGDHITCRPPIKHHGHMLAPKNVILYKTSCGLVAYKQTIVRTSRTMIEPIVKVTISDFASEAPIDMHVISVRKVILDVLEPGVKRSFQLEIRVISGVISIQSQVLDAAIPASGRISMGRGTLVVCPI